MNGRLSREERALLRTMTPQKPAAAAPHRDVAAFNAVQFHLDFRAAARQLGTKNLNQLAAETGVAASAIRNMARGITPSLATVLLLCDWAGMNPLHYLIRLDEPAANDSHARGAA